MYVLTKGGSYIMRDPVNNGKYVSTTHEPSAARFTYNQARALLRSKKQREKWIADYQMLEENTGKVVSKAQVNQPSSGGCFTGENEIEFNQQALDEVMKETNSIIGLAAWNMTQLQTYRNLLTQNLSYCDCVLTDISHAVRNRDKIPAHKRSIIINIQQDWERKRMKTKECIRYIDVLIDAINNNSTLEQIKYELSKNRPMEYKGRTKFYERIMNL